MSWDQYFRIACRIALEHGLLETVHDAKPTESDQTSDNETETEPTEEAA